MGAATLVRDGLIVVRGGGEMASAAARLLFLSGFAVVVLERKAPLAVRLRVSFAAAVLSGESDVAGLRGRLVPASSVAPSLVARSALPVVVDEAGESLESLAATVLVDGRMAKHAQDTRPQAASLVIGLGPGFVVGRHVDAVVETQRGPDLGRVYWEGSAQPDTAVPGPVLGVSHERVLRAPCAGVFRSGARIGDMVSPADEVGCIGGTPVRVQTRGLLRGLLGDGIEVDAGVKVGDVDPRGRAVDPAHISDKGRAVAAGVLEAVLRGTPPTH